MNTFNKTYKQIINDLFGYTYFYSHSHNKKLYPKQILMEDFRNKIFSSEIIDEAVYYTEWFKKLYDYLKGNEQSVIILSCQDLLKFFEDIPTIKVQLINNESKYLYINIVDFSNFNELLESYKILIKDSYNDLLSEIHKLYQDLQKATAEFISFPNNIDQNILLLNKNKFTLKDIRHEFNHFLQWLKYDDEYLDKNQNKKTNNLIYFKLLFNNTSDEQINLLLRPSEFEPYLNNALYKLFAISKKFTLTQNEFLFDLFKQNEESIQQYILRIRNLKYFNNLYNDYGCQLIILYNILNIKVDEIKKHIIEYFLEK